MRDPAGREVRRVNPEDREEYERRLREKHPDRLWWENLGGQKWLISLIVVAVVVMILVGYAVS